MNTLIKKLGMENKAFWGLIAAIIAFIVSLCLPAIGTLSVLGVRTIGLLVSFLIILITSALPVVVTSLLFVGLMTMSLGSSPDASSIGIASYQGSLKYALSGFGDPVVYFAVASFGLTAAITTTPLSKRILKGLLKFFHKDMKAVLFAIMLSACLISSLISNVPTCAVFMGVSLNLLELYKDDKEKKQATKAFMIAVPVSSMIGGMMTPAGSPINLMAIGVLERVAGVSISFAEWMVAGIPLAIVMLPLAWLVISHVHKLGPVKEEEIKTFASSLDVPAKMTPKEIKTVVIALTMLVLWLLSSWFSFFNVMTICILGCALLFMPGIKVLDVDAFLKNNSWDAFFLVAIVISLGGAMSDTGVMASIGGLLPTLDFNIILVLMVICLATFLCLLLDPVATSLVSLLGPILITLAATVVVSGVSSIDPGLSTMVVLAFAFCLCNCYLLPLDTVPLITYSKGYYSLSDMFKCTWILQLSLLVLVSLWVPVVGMMFQLME